MLIASLRKTHLQSCAFTLQQFATRWPHEFERQSALTQVLSTGKLNFPPLNQPHVTSGILFAISLENPKGNLRHCSLNLSHSRHSLHLRARQISSTGFFVEQTNLDVPANSKPDATSVPVNPCSFTYLETTPTAVFKVLSTLKTHKAGGLDNIPARLLKYCAIGITDSLTCLFNRKFELSEFPTAWKEALVVPIHKKRKHDRPRKLPIDCASTYRQQGSWTHRSWQTLPIPTALATWQAVWIQEGWRNSPSATETLPILEHANWQLVLRWSSLFRPEKGVRSGLAWWPLGQGGSSWYSRLSIGLDQEFFYRYVAKLPWLKASPHHLWKSEQASRKGPSLAHCYFQYTSMTLCLPPPCATLISSPTTRLRMFHPRALLS